MRYLQRDSYLPCCITDAMVCADDEREDRLVYRAASLWRWSDKSVGLRAQYVLVPVWTARLNKNRVRVLVLSRALTLFIESSWLAVHTIRGSPLQPPANLVGSHCCVWRVVSTSDEWLCPPTFWNINRTSTLRSFVGSFMCFEATSS